MNARTVYLHAITPIHSGTGQTVAVIDLPVAREKATGYPILPASSLKGVLRDTCDEGQVKDLFGEPDQAGALCFGDQRILCLPVRSYYGTFAYVTCPLVLQRLVRDLRALGAAPPFVGIPPAVTDSKEALPILVPAQGSVLAQDDKVYLEDLDLEARPAELVTTIARSLGTILFGVGSDAFVSRFGVVSDAVFSFFSETAMEVVARVALEDDTKTVKDGHLWYEEAVPAEAIFCGPVIIDSRHPNAAAAFLKGLPEHVIQIGGKSSVGRGLCRVVVA